MAGEWVEVRLKDVCEVITKGTPTTIGYSFTDSGINFVKSESITFDGVIARTKFAFIDLKTHGVLRRSQLRDGDILFSMAGVFIGKTAVVPKEILPANTNQAVGIVRLDQNRALPRFVDFQLRNPSYNKFMNNLVAQSAQPNLNLTEIGNLPITLPPLPEQRAIAHILGTLDDKIELNRRMNETLEAMARALFQSWFVDFDPVRAKAEGRLPAGRQATPAWPRSSQWCVYALECEDSSIYIGHTENLERRFEEHTKGKGADWTRRHPPKRVAYWEEAPTQTVAIQRERKLKSGSGREWLKLEIARRDMDSGGLPKPIADLFPDSFQDSELGEIPKGWRVGTLGDVAQHPRRGVQPSDIEATTPYIALEHMPRRSIALTEWGMADGLESNKFEFKKGEMLFGKLRPYFHKVGVAPVDGVCSTDIVVVRPKSARWLGFVLGHVSSTAFVDYTNAGSTGTKMPRTNWSDMAKYAIVLPPDVVTEVFTRQVWPSVEHILASIHESRTFAALRDALLPKLISGELRVKDAEQTVGSHVS